MMRHVLALLPLVLWAAPAHAIAVKLCVDADVAFDDHVVPYVGHDFFYNDGPKPVRGLALLVEPAASASFVAYTDVTGPDAGCADVTFILPGSYQVTAIAEVNVGGNEVTVRTSSTGGVWTYTFPSAQTTGGDQSYTLPVSRKWNIVAVASHALWRSDMGRTSAVVEYYTTDNNGILHSPCGGECITSRTEPSGQIVTEIYIDTPRAYKKVATAYALGRALANDMGIPVLDTTADTTYCGAANADLTLDSLENSGAGVVEGFAHYFAAVAFVRNQAGNDCPYPYWRSTNWDRLAAPCYKQNEAAAGHVLDCGEGPALPPLLAVVPERNQRAYCDQRMPPLDFNALYPYTVVPLDALRLFFDLTTDHSLGRSDIGVALANSLPWVPPANIDELEAAFVAQGLTFAEVDEAFTDHGLKY